MSAEFMQRASAAKQTCWAACRLLNQPAALQMLCPFYVPEPAYLACALQLEEEVSTALTYLGQHLSSRASLLWRPRETSLQALPRHLEGLHPLLLAGLHTTQTLQPGTLAPGLMDRDLGAAPVRCSSCSGS
jgi:hypothetical protein